MKQRFSFIFFGAGLRSH